MFKFNRLVCALLVCTVVGSAFGGAVLLREFHIDNPDVMPVEADGMAMLNYVAQQDKTIVQLIVSGFGTQGWYAVLDGCEKIHFDTDNNGAATVHAELPGDFSDSHIDIWVDFRDPCNDPGFLRNAVLCNPRNASACP